jgi:Domain of unknown function (DUF4249)
VLMVTVSFLAGCKKVIQVNLDNSESQIVITGEVTNQPGPFTVTISKTANFYQDNNFPPVSGAFVSIAGNGVVDTLSEVAPGRYATHILEGIEGVPYDLLVASGGKQYKATSIMPAQVELDSIGFIASSRDNSLFPVAYFQDPAGVPNYYQFIEFVDGKRLANGRGNFVFDDRLSDGRYISRVLYSDSSNLKSGTVVSVEMKCIDKNVYNYINQMLQVSGGGNSGFASPTPDNPVTNISGGALGYFSANTISSRHIKVP